MKVSLEPLDRSLRQRKATRQLQHFRLLSNTNPLTATATTTAAGAGAGAGAVAVAVAVAVVVVVVAVVVVVVVVIPRAVAREAISSGEETQEEGGEVARVSLVHLSRGI
jgi:uncharacterized protein HemX